MSCERDYSASCSDQLQCPSEHWSVYFILTIFHQTHYYFDIVIICPETLHTQHPNLLWLVTPPSPLQVNLRWPLRRLLRYHQLSQKLTRDPSSQVCNLDCVVYPAHLYSCIWSTWPHCRLSPNQHHAPLTPRSFFSCLPLNPWSLWPCISTHRLGCYLKLLGLSSVHLS